MLAVIAYLSYMLNSSIKAFAAQSWHLYLGMIKILYVQINHCNLFIHSSNIFGSA